MALDDKARGQRIAALRKRRHLTQQAMAEKLKIGYRTYQTWEAGTLPEWDNLKKLAAFFHVKPEDILGETPDIEALLGVQNGTGQIGRIEEKLDRALAELAAIRLSLAAPSRGQSPQQSRTRRKPKGS